MIEIEPYEYPKINLFDYNDNLVGEIKNDVELTRFRIEIAKEGIGGYWFLFDDIKSVIDKEGKLSDCSDELFTENLKGILTLYGIQKMNRG